MNPGNHIPLILAHRGFCKACPENTIASFLAAAEIGAQGVETDVQLDKNNTLILFHDRILKNGNYVFEYTQAELSREAGYHVPSLSEALAAVPDILWNIEVKTIDSAPPLVELLKNYQRKSNIIISSFIHSIVESISEQLDVDGAFLVSHSPSAPLLDLSATSKNIKYIVWNSGTVSSANLQWAAAAGLKNLVYGFARPGEHAAFMRPDVAALITDFPDQI